jgi:hypothetical protein
MSSANELPKGCLRQKTKDKNERHAFTYRAINQPHLIEFSDLAKLLA